MKDQPEPNRNTPLNRVGKILLAIAVLIFGIWAWWDNFGSPDAQENPWSWLFGAAAVLEYNTGVDPSTTVALT